MPDAPEWYRWNGTTLELRIQVQTRSGTEGLAAPSGELLRVRVNAPPVEGRANRRLLAVLARAFGVPVSRVRLVSGTRSRRKTVRIEDPGRLPENLKSVLAPPGRLTKREKPSKNG